MIEIRQEVSANLPIIYDLLDKSFEDVPESNHKEKFLVEQLHNSIVFIPQLSLIAEINGKIVGYILLTKVEIILKNGGIIPSLSVAPLAVLPKFQKQGTGGALLKEAHKRAASLGYKTTLVLGHKDYYCRFGYRKAIDYGIEFPFDVPCELCMARELVPHSLDSLSGIVRYPAVFFE